MDHTPMSLSNHNNSRAGFMLFEFVIYCGIASGITASLVIAVMHAINEKNRLGQLEMIERSARLAENVIARTVQSAESIVSPQGNATSTILTLAFATGTTPAVFSLSNGRIELAKGSLPPQQITDGSTTVTALEFRNIASNGTRGTIRLSFTLKSGTDTRNFTTTHTIYAH